MATIGDFISIKKNDAYQNLIFGARYPSYINWSGFFIPDFPADGLCLETDFQNDIRDYTLARLETEPAVSKLFSLSAAELIGDRVSVAESVIDTGIFNTYSSVDQFLTILVQLRNKYEKDISFNYALALNTDNVGNLSSDAVNRIESLIQSDFFSSLTLYGDFNQQLSRVSFFLKLAKFYEMPINLHLSQNLQGQEKLPNLIDLLEPKKIIGTAEQLAKAMPLFKSKPVKAVVIPGYVKLEPQKNAENLRVLLDSGIKVQLCTDNLLFYNCSLSEFAFYLCNTTLFTKQELVSLLTASI